MIGPMDNKERIKRYFLLSCLGFGTSIWLISSLWQPSNTFWTPSYRHYLNTSFYNTSPVFTFNEYAKFAQNIREYTVADPKTSRISIIKQNTVFKVGQKVFVRIDLYDKRKHHLKQGGDLLRIWLVEGSSNVNGKVVDHENGTYTGFVLLPWRGKILLIVSIEHVKEHVGIVAETIKRHGLLHPIYTKYIKTPKQYCVSACSPKPVRYWKTVCNLTSQNSDVEWYCEGPADYNLTCKDWKLTKMDHTTFIGDTNVSFIRSHLQMKIRQKIYIQVEGETKVIKEPTIPCNKINRNLTWSLESLSGFYYNKTWRTISCKNTLQRTKNSYLRCLKGRHILFIGDSNVRSFTFLLNSYLGLKERTHRLSNKAWQQYFYSVRLDWNISMSWCAHETPFYSWPFFDNKLIQPPSHYLDNIGKNNNSIILLHMYFHFGRASPDYFRARVRQLRVSVENLLKRAPLVDVFIKGPHASRYFKMLDTIDYTHKIHQQIWFQEFIGLHHRVVYLEEWDITSGTENRDIHPKSWIVRDMVHTFLSYICG